MASASPSNEFLEVVSKAKAWLKNQDSSLSLDKIKEGDKKIIITISSDSLFIVPPDCSTEQWTVWSDNDNAAHVISPHLEYLTNQDRNIDEILQKLQSLFLMKSQTSVTDSEDYDDCEGDDGGSDEELSEFYDQYYGGDDDAENEEVKKKEKYVDDDTDDVSAEAFFTGDGSPGAVHRLLQDLKGLKKSAGKFGIDGNPRGDNLFVWDIQLTDFDTKSLLYKDLVKYAKDYNKNPSVEMEMRFPQDYPMNPPFVRVIRPRFQFLTGHVTVGGSVCMQMLTRSGWSPSNDIEGILIQVRAEIMSDSKARLDGNPNREYSESEAKSAFDRMVMKYGWNR